MKKEYKRVDEKGSVSYYCSRCAMYRPASEFYDSAIQHKSRCCKTCTIRRNTDSRRSCRTKYRVMLEYLRNVEKKKAKGAKPPMYIDEDDAKDLYRNVWERQSAISKDKDNLTLIRWKDTEEITPWNCVLVTKKEARDHNSTDDKSHLYSESRIRKIERKLKGLKAKLAEN